MSRCSWAAILLLLTLGIQTIHCNNTMTAKRRRTKLTVYYETLCKDSRHFMSAQLAPLMKSPIGKFVDLELIPYGKATTHGRKGNYTFRCQHSSEECQGNIIHSCALKIYKSEDAQRFIFCTMSRDNPPREGENCSRDLALTYDQVRACSASQEGGNYLAENGDKTHKQKPNLYFVPWIVHNNWWDKDKMERSLTNLKAVVCKELEEEACK